MNQSAESFTRNPLPNLAGFENKPNATAKVGTNTSINSVEGRVINIQGLNEPTNFNIAPSEPKITVAAHN